MGIRYYKPTSPGRRDATVSDFSELTAGAKPEKKLLRPKPKKGGRNHHGKITARHRGGGHKQRYRLIDFRRDKDGIPAKVASIQYDPNRTAFIALVRYDDGEFSYILAPQRIQAGDKVVSGERVDIKPGNAMPMANIPVGTIIHNVEMKVGKGGQIVRSAGNGAQVLSSEGKYTLLRLPSGEVRYILSECMATIGQVSAPDHKNIKLGKAGANRHRGRRPQVRGVVMSPADHPHGGGEGKSPIGMPSPKTPWGKPALGYRTRNKKKSSGRFIVRRRGER